MMLPQTQPGWSPSNKARKLYGWSTGKSLPLVMLARGEMPSGACLFCARSAFETAGGFNENYYAAEDVVFVVALKRQGRFIIPAETVVTSGRKVRAHSFLTFARLFTRLALRGSSGLRNRRGLDFWYEPEREKAK